MRAADPSAVILAAGSGTRFGGMKQLAAIGPEGIAIMDVLIRRAARSGFAKAVIVVAPGMEASVRVHIDEHRDPTATIPVELVGQRVPHGRTKPLGTADAVLAARSAIDGSFAVMNADDLYPEDAFTHLGAHLRETPSVEHALVAFRVGRTLIGNRPVSRALVDVEGGFGLATIREGTVTHDGDGLRFEGRTGRAVPLSADQIISMNMWGFRTSVFDALAGAVGEFVADEREGEVYLPDVVASMIASGAVVRVFVSEGACVGVTHAEDVAAVTAALR
jgi:bifunctional N-acetylglucosamine-1-phosphate-uridyltransferase/glucosamine-1-phosphate-acetyltransferase GlmU-like protein